MDGTHPPLRGIADDERAQLHALHRRAAAHEHPARLETALAQLARGDGHGLVAARDGRVVGFVLGSRTDNGEVVLIGPVVAAEERERGLGTRLIAGVLARFGTRRCRIAVDARDRDARRRCRRHGLRQLDQHGDRLEFAGVWTPPPGEPPPRADDQALIRPLVVGGGGRLPPSVPQRSGHRPLRSNSR